MPRARRRRLARQRKKHGIVPHLRLAVAPSAATPPVREMTYMPIRVLTSLSRLELLALAASAKTREERALYRQQLKRIG